MKEEIQEQLTVAMNSGARAINAAVRVVLLSGIAICFLGARTLSKLDSQLAESEVL
jgi:hypothetical protein